MGSDGQVPKWTKGADCKSVAIGFQGSNPCLPTMPSLLEPGTSIKRGRIVSLPHVSFVECLLEPASFELGELDENLSLIGS